MAWRDWKTSDWVDAMNVVLQTTKRAACGPLLQRMLLFEQPTCLILCETVPLPEHERTLRETRISSRTHPPTPQESGLLIRPNPSVDADM